MALNAVSVVARGAREQELDPLLIGGSSKAFAKLFGVGPGYDAHSATGPADHHPPVLGHPVLEWIRNQPAASIFRHGDL